MKGVMNLSNFTRGMITGAIVAATMSMMMRDNRGFGMSRKGMKNSKKFVRTASNILENFMDR